MILRDQRKRIDELDRELVRLLNRRAQISIELGKAKQELGLPLKDGERETEIFSRAERLNPGPLDGEAMRAIFGCILEESRRITSRHIADLTVA